MMQKVGKPGQVDIELWILSVFVYDAKGLKTAQPSY